MTFEIEHGVPMPKLRNKYPFEHMAVGDSFFVSDEEAEEMGIGKTTISSAASYAGKRLNVIFITKAAEKEGVKGIRVWRDE